MLDYIRRNYKVGDTMEISTSEGVFTGAIEFVNEKCIVLRQANGKICGIAATDIFNFKADCPKSAVSENQRLSDEMESESVDDSAAFKEKENTSETSDLSEFTEQNGENTTDAGPVLGNESENVVEPKVVGHIDLEKLQRIDPQLRRRHYFPHTDGLEENATDTETLSESIASVENTESENSRAENSIYVAAKGVVTYYNSLRSYGFIQDDASGENLYFKFSQVVDPLLPDFVRKGTRVVYTIDRNEQGPTAHTIHLAHTVKHLLAMADEMYRAHRYYFARTLAEHVLEVDADNGQALKMVDTVKESLDKLRNMRNDAQFGGELNPYAVYSQAKRAYLKKDYDEAEKLYLRALEEGERTESCVKDLVTLYVSRFKQAEEPEEKEKCRQKAVDFLQSHVESLPDNLTTKQFLALNFYLPVLEYEKFLAIVDEILADPQVSEVISRRVFYLWQKGIVLNKLGKKDEALSLVEETLKLSPYSRQLQNLKHAILHPDTENKEETENEFLESE